MSTETSFSCSRMDIVSGRGSLGINARGAGGLFDLENESINALWICQKRPCKMSK